MQEDFKHEKEYNAIRKIVTAVLAATLAAGLLAGCNGERSKSTEKTKGTTEVSTEVTTEKTEAQTTEAVSTEAETEAQTTEAASSEEDTGTTKAEASTTEAQSEDVSSLPGTYPMDMVFSSGAGGWSTTLTLSEDGSFTGAFPIRKWEKEMRMIIQMERCISVISADSLQISKSK